LNNSIKGKNLREATIQLNRAEVQKNILIKNIYREYEIYFQIVRKSLLSSVEKGIHSIYSDLFISDKALNSKELNIFLHENIKLLIHSKLPLITIEQLKLENIKDPQKQKVNVTARNDSRGFRENQTVTFDYDNEILPREPIEFYCSNNSNIYGYYDSFCEKELSSVNLDESNNVNPFSNQIIIEQVEYEKHFVESVLELIEETNDNKLNDYEKINQQVSDVFISNDNLNFFDFIDKSLQNFLLNLSYEVNSELFKIKLIKKIISEDTFKCLSNNNYIVKHPHPFVIRYDLDPNKLSVDYSKLTDIFLLNITNVELEFYNLDLSICKNNINDLKNSFRLLMKKQRYWKNKELTSTDN